MAVFTYLPLLSRFGVVLSALHTVVFVWERVSVSLWRREIHLSMAAGVFTRPLEHNYPESTEDRVLDVVVE